MLAGGPYGLVDAAAEGTGPAGLAAISDNESASGRGPVMTTPPESTFTADRHRHVWADGEMVLERFRETDDGLKAELTVTAEGGLLFRGRVNLGSERSMKMLAGTLTDRTDIVDWFGMLQQAAWRSLERFRDGDPLIRLADVTPEARRWILEPYLEGSRPTVVFAPGGSGKSFFALTALASVASGHPLLGVTPALTGPVAYLDWEADADTQRRRLDAICRPLDLDLAGTIHYRVELAPLHATADRLRHRLESLGIVACVVDSVGMARGGAPESAEETIRLFAAVRSLKIPTLCIDHVSKDQIRRTTGQRLAFGSVYTTNAAGLCWALLPDWRDGELRIRLENTKSNNWAPVPPRGLTFTFDGAGVHILTSDRPPLIPVDDDGRKLADRIAELVDGYGQVTVAELAEGLGIDAHTVNRTLRREEGPRFLHDDNRPARWRLTVPDHPVPF